MAAATLSSSPSSSSSSSSSSSPPAPSSPLTLSSSSSLPLASCGFASGPTAELGHFLRNAIPNTLFDSASFYRPLHTSRPIDMSTIVTISLGSSSPPSMRVQSQIQPQSILRTGPRDPDAPKKSVSWSDLADGSPPRETHLATVHNKEYCFMPRTTRKAAPRTDSLPSGSFSSSESSMSATSSSSSSSSLLRSSSSSAAATAPVENSPFSILSEELLLEIVQRLDERSLQAFACVCKRFYLAKCLTEAPMDMWDM